MTKLSPETAFSCPQCQEMMVVKNTFYEEKTYRKIRQRDCMYCGHRLFTVQDNEQILKKGTFKLPRNVRKNKIVITNLPEVC